MRTPNPPAVEQPGAVDQRRAISFEKAVFLGVGISCVDRADVIRFVTDKATVRRRALVHNVNAHAMNIASRDARFAAALDDADVVFCDGFGVKALARLGGVRLGERMKPPEWIDALFEACADEGLAPYFLGDEERVVGAFAAEVARRHPRLRVAGAHHGFFDVNGQENSRVLDLINASRADVVVTGMGMPRQELWAHANLQALEAGVVVAAGALFRVYAGLARPCPPGLSRHGLEWAWRLAHEPRRLFARYVVGNAALLFRVLYTFWLKRLLDLALASALLLAGLPLLLACWVLVSLERRGPVFFVHERVGKDGRRFRMFKFRTLPRGFPPQAPKAEAEAAPMTATGRFLRRTALDELPQLFNVLKGDMALVGPRPEMPFIADRYRERERRRLTVRPGATGPWQVARLKGVVTGRAIDEDLSYDLDYLRRVGLLVDLGILAETAGCMAALALRRSAETLSELQTDRETRDLPF